MIYFISQGDKFVKIGYTNTDVGQRLSALQVGNPNELRLMAAFLGDAATEVQIHRFFEVFRVRGEWFTLEPVVREFVHLVVEDDFPTAMNKLLELNRREMEENKEPPENVIDIKEVSDGS